MPEEFDNPLDRLIRSCPFTLRPTLLEKWLWDQNVSAAAERVFWLHFRLGRIAGDWCSRVPLGRVAAECRCDESTVTRAYQRLSALGVILRPDAGRDPANPFRQATPITQVVLPAELAAEIEHCHPRPLRGRAPETPKTSPPNGPSEPAPIASTALRDPPRLPASPTGEAPLTAAVARPAAQCPAESPEPPAPPAPATRGAGPFAGLSLRESVQRLGLLLSRMSPGERSRYSEATRAHHECITFDANTQLSAVEQRMLLDTLCGKTPQPTDSPSRPHVDQSPALEPRATGGCSRRAGPRSIADLIASKGPAVGIAPPPAQCPDPRRLSAIAAARLQQQLSRILGRAERGATARLLCEITWSIEQGALHRFEEPHAVNIALKKVRERLWTRPHDLPSTWSRAGAEHCAAA